jgi:alpha-L-arabinofuranosidase
VGQQGIYASAVWDKNSKEIIIKIVNAADKEQRQDLQLATSKKPVAQAELFRLKSDDLKTVNNFEQPKAVAPVRETLAVKGKKVSVTLPAKSVTVLKIKTK